MVGARVTRPHPTPDPSPPGEGWPEAGDGRAAAPAPVGVLALQGDFARHAEALTRAGLESREVRRPEELESLYGLILPGGESTTYLKFFDREEGWKESLTRFAESGKPVLATCAGLILLASGVENPPQPSLGVIDVDVVRNAYGRQLDSFVGTATAKDGKPVEAVFIRAPKISRVGPGVEVLVREGEDPVLVRQDNVYGATFHPELSTDSALHRQIFGA
jgi:5'-phosphate synthase pdxT subunit